MLARVRVYGCVHTDCTESVHPAYPRHVYIFCTILLITERTPRTFSRYRHSIEKLISERAPLRCGDSAPIKIKATTRTHGVWPGPAVGAIERRAA
eukprot:6194485-Pleurochrysis_carterae.AAC.1